MEDLRKNQTIENLMRALSQKIGNKSYLKDLEKLLKTLDVSVKDLQALEHLTRDINYLK